MVKRPATHYFQTPEEHAEFLKKDLLPRAGPKHMVMALIRRTFVRGETRYICCKVLVKFEKVKAFRHSKKTIYRALGFTWAYIAFKACNQIYGFTL